MFCRPFEQMPAKIPGLRLMTRTVTSPSGKTRREVTHGLLWTPQGMMRVSPGQTVVREKDGTAMVWDWAVLAA